ncbi:hypothetical protein Tco_1082954 [Tanacetum coccineum]|uniref:Uncharacterized protein n=1 Tax=Tanacetum coccineum TaxID=301880 RepID=A0ABQ5I347_9ASTR
MYSLFYLISSKRVNRKCGRPTPDMKGFSRTMEGCADWSRIWKKKVQAEESMLLWPQDSKLVAMQKANQEVNAAAMFYTENDWLNILAQVATNSSLSQVLLGDDVTEETFPERMAALIKRKRHALDGGALERAKILDFKRTLPLSKPTLEEPSFRKLKPTEISSDDAVALQVSAAGMQVPAGDTISSSVAATRTPDVFAKSSST